MLEEPAIRGLKRAVELDLRIPAAHFLRGEIHLFGSNIQAALDEFQKELELDPIMWLAYWRMRNAYDRVEKWDEAERITARR